MTLDVITERLRSDNSWREVTKLEVEDVIELLEFTLTTTYFRFRGQIYRQKFGTAMGSPVSPLVADIYMEYLEQTAIASVPLHLKPKLWKRYVDDILEVINKQAVEELTDHLNRVDDTGSIKFTYETEAEKMIPFLDMQIVRKEDGHLKLLVYRKKTHTDQYLNFNSQHPLQHKLSVVRTLLTRCSRIVTEADDKKVEEEHIKGALSRCGYPDWCFRRVKQQIEDPKLKKGRGKSAKEKQDGVKRNAMAVIPYVQGVSEAVARVYKRHGVTTAMRPFQTIRSLVVHPKDKLDKNETTECVYRIPCKSCEKVYIGETGRSFGTRMKEHRKEVQQQEGRKYTRSAKQTAETEQNKSAITDHAARENHVINWDEATVIGRESDRMTRWIKEAVKIRKEKSNTINRDEGAYHLSHVYDTLLSVATSSGEQKVRKRQQLLPKRH